MEGKFKDKGVIVFEYDATKTDIEGLVLAFEAGMLGVHSLQEYGGAFVLREPDAEARMLVAVGR